MKMIQDGQTLHTAALKAGVDVKTARKYRDAGQAPSSMKQSHTWRTRQDPFAEVWHRVKPFLEEHETLEAKALFLWLQKEYPGRFEDGQLRTFQRRVKAWRAEEGPGREVFFEQVHSPGELSQSDFTSMNSLKIRVAGQPFGHLIYHFVLTYSNWETGTICFSESFEALSEGLQNALFELGGAPRIHQTDCLSAAVRKVGDPEVFTQRYQGLLDHYGLRGRRSNPARPNENGDVEQRHHRLKRSLDQALIFRGSRDFDSIEEYQRFLRKHFSGQNANRARRFEEERAALRPLPARRVPEFKKIEKTVGPSATLNIAHNTYSVPSRLIGERVEVRLYAQRLEIWYGQRRIETIERLRGEGKKRINYRHVIDSLSRKPGAFRNYRHREAMFPSSRFRMAYDALRERKGSRADRIYLAILKLAAHESQSAVEAALSVLLESGEAFDEKQLAGMIAQPIDRRPHDEGVVEPVALCLYDQLLTAEGAPEEARA